MTNEKFEQFLKDAARDYNAPPSIIPREEIWDRIREAQRVRAEIPLKLERGGAAAATARTRFASNVRWWPLAAAAVLLLVAGIGVGRYTNSRRSSVAENTPFKKPGVTQPTRVAVAPDVSVKSPKSTESTRRQFARAPEYERPNAARMQRDNSANRDALYMLASVRHLSEAEAMLTQFRQDTINKATDAAVVNWSRDLLSNTRLLLDSPAARDPRRKRLLEDLELVLTQIVQLNADPNAKDRETIESTIKQGNVMTRLRTAIPAGQPKGS